MVTDELGSENFGCAIFNPAPCDEKATIAITGLGRSGTTMVARILRELGVPMGKSIESRFLEDESILYAIKTADMVAFNQICRARDDLYPKWGFKCPAMRVKLQDAVENMRAPRLIVPFRDILAISMRNNLEVSTDTKTALGLAARGYAKMLAAFDNIDVPTLFLSYEKALQYPSHTVKQIATFCGIELSAESAERISGDIICNGDPLYFGAKPDEVARPRRTLLIGNSHAQVIRKALDGQDQIEVHWLKANEEARFGEVSIKDAEAKVSELRKHDRLILMQLGTMHNLIGLLNHEQPFTVSRAVDGKSTTNVIPEASLRATFRKVAENDQVVLRLAAAAQCKVLHVMPPPPKENLGHLATTTKAYRGKAIAEHGFSPAANRLALWQIEEETLRDWLAEHGIGTLPIPDIACTPEGYLHPDYSAPDATHANLAYGAKLIEDIRS